MDTCDDQRYGGDCFILLRACIERPVERRKHLISKVGFLVNYGSVDLKLGLGQTQYPRCMRRVQF